MPAPIHSLLYGLTDPRQAREAGELGVDGVILQLGADLPLAVSPQQAQAIAAALPPLTVRFAIVPVGMALPAGFGAAITSVEDEPPAGAVQQIAAVPAHGIEPEQIPCDLETVWLLPRRDHPLPYDSARVGQFARRFRLLLEAPDTDSGLEAMLQLMPLYAVVLGSAVWFAPGICDLDALETALETIARVNRRRARAAPA